MERAVDEDDAEETGEGDAEGFRRSGREGGWVVLFYSCADSASDINP